MIDLTTKPWPKIDPQTAGGPVSTAHGVTHDSWNGIKWRTLVIEHVSHMVSLRVRGTKA